MTDDQSQKIFETIQLPALIKNEKVPTITFINPATQESQIVFTRHEFNVEMHINVYNILQNNDNLDDILEHFSQKTKVKTIIIYDENQRMEFGLKKLDSNQLFN